jgi:transcriptional regulator with XRE-family HTH domain
MRGRVVLEASVLKQLRHSRQLSQEELANECSVRHFRVSISSIKRAETSKPVLFRIARELARFFNVPAERLVCTNSSVVRSAEGSGESGQIAAAAWHRPWDSVMDAHHSEQANARDASHAYLRAAQVRYEQRYFVDALALVDRALSQDGPIAVRYELNRLKGRLLRRLELLERLVPCLLETAELARDDRERCDAWCELFDAYRSVNQREDAEKAMRQAERYAAFSTDSSERDARRFLGEDDTAAARSPESGLT